jgi:hypothetical protein
MHTIARALAAGAAGLAALACQENAAAPTAPDPGAIVTARVADPAVCAPGAGGFSLVIDNPWAPMPLLSERGYEGEEDDEFIELLVTVFDETEIVAGVTTRVVEEREWADGELVEVSRNYFVQAADGTVCYYGEHVDNYEDGEIADNEGSWRADDAGAAPGIFMPADPRPGLRFAQENAPGIAEDEARVIGSGPIEVPVGRFERTIRLREYNPLDGDKGYKVFAFGVGLVQDAAVQLVQQ